MGNYDKKPSYKNGLAEKVSIESWVSSKHNMGMVIDRKSYDALKRCRKEFCNFDDYNWDWSLQFISASCLKLPLQTMVSWCFSLRKIFDHLQMSLFHSIYLHLFPLVLVSITIKVYLLILIISDPSYYDS